MADEQKKLMELMSKPITEMTPADLSSIASLSAAIKAQADERLKTISETKTKEVFTRIAKVIMDTTVTELGWTVAKLPKLIVVPTDIKNDKGEVTSQTYDIQYVTTKVRATSGGTRTGTTTRGDPASGKITLSKIIELRGGLDHFELNGKPYQGQKDVAKELKKVDGTPEDVYEINKKGDSASAVITRRHAKEVTMVYKDGGKETVEEAVAKMEEARKKEPAV